MTNKEAKEKLYMEWQKFLENNIDYAGISEAYKMAFKALEQEPKTGYWIQTQEKDDAEPCILWECSECHKEFRSVVHKVSNYCPNCGCRMVEPQETETWNGIHAQITAPNGTFERIFNDADDDSDI